MAIFEKIESFNKSGVNVGVIVPYELKNQVHGLRKAIGMKKFKDSGSQNELG